MKRFQNIRSYRASSRKNALVRTDLESNLAQKKRNAEENEQNSQNSAIIFENANCLYCCSVILEERTYFCTISLSSNCVFIRLYHHRSMSSMIIRKGLCYIAAYLIESPSNDIDDKFDSLVQLIEMQEYQGTQKLSLPPISRFFKMSSSKFNAALLLYEVTAIFACSSCIYLISTL